MGYIKTDLSQTNNMEEFKKAKKKFLITIAIVALIDLAFIGGFIASVLNLKTGCAEKAPQCPILRGDGWCGITLNFTNYHYICPYDGNECFTDDETVPCYGTYDDDKCPKT